MFSFFSKLTSSSKPTILTSDPKALILSNWVRNFEEARQTFQQNHWFKDLSNLVLNYAKIYICFTKQWFNDKQMKVLRKNPYTLNTIGDTVTFHETNKLFMVTTDFVINFKEYQKVEKSLFLKYTMLDKTHHYANFGFVPMWDKTEEESPKIKGMNKNLNDFENKGGGVYYNSKDRVFSSIAQFSTYTAENDTLKKLLVKVDRVSKKMPRREDKGLETVGWEINCQTRELTFFVNGERVGIAFKVSCDVILPVVDIKLFGSKGKTSTAIKVEIVDSADFF